MGRLFNSAPQSTLLGKSTLMPARPPLGQARAGIFLPMKARTTPSFYVLLLPKLVAVAKEYGYALGVHGSLTRDMDLIAVPWTEDAGDEFEMATALKDAMGGVWTGKDWDHLLKRGSAHPKPHWRTAWSIHLTEMGADGPYLDVSVMPRIIP